MTKGDIVLLSKTIHNVLNSEKDSSLKFKYYFIKIDRAIENEINTLTKIENEINAILTPFENDKIEIYKKYGEPIENGYSLLPQNVEIANEELSNLVNVHLDAIEQHNTRMKEYADVLNEDAELTLPSISLNLIPDWIESKDLTVLSHINLINEE